MLKSKKWLNKNKKNQRISGKRNNKIKSFKVFKKRNQKERIKKYQDQSIVL